MGGVRDTLGNFHPKKRQPEAQHGPFRAEVFEARTCHLEQPRVQELPAITCLSWANAGLQEQDIKPGQCQTKYID